MELIVNYLPLFGVVALAFVFFKNTWVSKQDEGNEKMIREIQTTWNGHGATGFHSNPSLWGTIVLK